MNQATAEKYLQELIVSGHPDAATVWITTDNTSYFPPGGSIGMPVTTFPINTTDTSSLSLTDEQIRQLEVLIHYYRQLDKGEAIHIPAEEPELRRLSRFKDI